MFLTALQMVCLGQTVPDSLLLTSDTTGKTVRTDAFDIAYEVLDFLKIKKKKPGKAYHDQDTVIRNVFSVLPLLKYSPATRLAGGVLLNAGFLTGPVKKTNLSAIQSQITYTMNRQFIFKIKSLVWTNANRFNFSGDWRFLQYPSYTYGLGSQTKESQQLLIDYSYIRFYQFAYRQVVKNVFIGLGYCLDYRFNIRQVDYNPSSDLMLYSGGTLRTVSAGPAVSVLYDTRKNPNNPVKGAYFINFVYRQNVKAAGSDENWRSFTAEGRKYFAFPRSSDNILAFWTWNWFTFDQQVPYLDLPSNYQDPYENQGRGYIQSRFRSRNLISFETEYRFALTANRLFGGVVFANVQSVSNWQTRSFDKFYPAAGAGIRIKINKYTNTNVAADYAIGVDGSHGVFFNLGEVF